jgi:hypothetical protein
MPKKCSPAVYGRSQSNSAKDTASTVSSGVRFEVSTVTRAVGRKAGDGAQNEAQWRLGPRVWGGRSPGATIEQGREGSVEEDGDCVWSLFDEEAMVISSGARHPGPAPFLVTERRRRC